MLRTVTFGEKMVWITTIMLLVSALGQAVAVPAAGTTGPLVAYKDVEQVTFASAETAYALVRQGQALGLSTSLDGGKTWTLMPGTPFFPLKASSSISPVPTLAITNSGYVFVTTGTEVEIIPHTASAWIRAQLPGAVESVTGEGTALWALVDGAAQQRPPYPSPPPTGWIYVSADSGRTWTRRSTLPSGIGPYLELDQANAQVLYALAPGEKNTAAGRFGGLARSTDAGHHWQVVSQPCSGNYAPRFFDHAIFSATSAEDLWIACGDQEGVDGHSVTQVLRSSDGGQHWDLVAGTNEVRIPPNFPDTEYVPPVGLPATGLFRRGSAWLVLTGPGRLIRSANGGNTWSNGAPAQVEAERPLQVFMLGTTIIVRTETSLWICRGAVWRRSGYN